MIVITGVALIFTILAFFVARHLRKRRAKNDENRHERRRKIAITSGQSVDFRIPCFIPIHVQSSPEEEEVEDSEQTQRDPVQEPTQEYFKDTTSKVQSYSSRKSVL